MRDSNIDDCDMFVRDVFIMRQINMIGYDSYATIDDETCVLVMFPSCSNLI